MHFHVGPFAYTVIIEAAPLIDPETGDPRCGLCVYDDRTLHLSPDLAPHNRWDTLLHEIYHAWLFHLPAPADEEQACNLFAMASAAAHRDLDKQGGLAALAALRPDDDHDTAGARVVTEDRTEGTDADPPAAADAVDVAVDSADYTYEPIDCRESAEAKTFAHGGRASCATCDMIISAASIVTDPPGVRWDHARRGLVVDRAMYCPCCHHVQRWTEGTTGYGIPNGDPIAAPTFDRDASEVNAFLVAHPEAEGLIA